ncbi:UNVERIFIED_CONTAM: hypothetical protein HDU68_001611 [Siphonaria sp. JEL0065]|nr:hypothetical protein HDU68_001611 [Siphonaria sp. JEL0065]
MELNAIGINEDPVARVVDDHPDSPWSIIPDDDFQTRTIRPMFVNETVSITSIGITIPTIVASLSLRYNPENGQFFDEEMLEEMEGLVRLLMAEIAELHERFVEETLDSFTLQDEPIQLIWSSLRNHEQPIFTCDWSKQASQVPWRIIVTHINKRGVHAQFLPAYAPAVGGGGFLKAGLAFRRDNPPTPTNTQPISVLVTPSIARDGDDSRSHASVVFTSTIS